MLLYPERGLVLNATGADIVQLCTGERTVGAIVEQLAGKYAREPRGRSSSEVLDVPQHAWPSAGSSGAAMT